MLNLIAIESICYPENIFATKSKDIAASNISTRDDFEIHKSSMYLFWFIQK